MKLEINIPDELADELADVISEMPFTWLPIKKYSQFEGTKKEFVEYVLKGYLKFLYKGHKRRIAQISTDKDSDLKFEL